MALSDKCIGQFQSSSKNATDKWTFEKSLCVWHCKNIGLLSGEVCGSVRWVSASLEGEITIENTLEETERVARSQIEVQRDQCWFMAIFSISCIDHEYLIETCSMFIIWAEEYIWILTFVYFSLERLLSFVTRARKTARPSSVHLKQKPWLSKQHLTHIGQVSFQPSKLLMIEIETDCICREVLWL